MLESARGSTMKCFAPRWSKGEDVFVTFRREQAQISADCEFLFWTLKSVGKTKQKQVEQVESLFNMAPFPEIEPVSDK